jgi:amidase
MSPETLLVTKDATEIAERVRAGDVTAGELVEASISRIERANPKINVVTERLYDRAREAARNPDRSAPFAGVPIALKDLAIAAAGVPVHDGSRLAPVVHAQDSLMVRRFVETGMIPVCTSTTPEQGLRLMTESEAFGITRNPWNTAHTSGGSSGGAAALVAAGAVPVAHASDGGGSIRVPAACTGLVGLKPSRGRVPFEPFAPDLWYGLIVQHVVTRSVRDSAALLDILSAPSATSPYLAAPASTTFARAAMQRPKGLRLGVYRGSPLGLDISNETLAALDMSVRLARDLGHHVEEIDLRQANRAFMFDFVRLVATSIAGRMRMESTRLGRNVLPEIERSTRIIARLGEMTSGGELAAALERLQAASLDIREHTLGFDAVLMPVIAHPPLEVGSMSAAGADAMIENMLDRLRLTKLLRIERFLGEMIDKSLWFTHWPAIQNVTGQPAIALPVHVSAAGLPLGIQAVGRMGEEATLLALAAQMEKASGWLDRRAGFLPPS